MNLFKRKKMEALKEPLEKDELSGLIDATPIEAIYPFVYKETQGLCRNGRQLYQNNRVCIIP